MTDLDRRIWDGLLDWKSPKEIALELSCSLSLVYLVAQQNGAIYERGKLKEREREQILERLKRGEAIRWIADDYDVCPQTIREIRNKAGIPRTETPKTRQDKKDEAAKRLERAKAKLREFAPSFEYVKGYVRRESFIVLRCTICGNEKIIRYDKATQRPQTCRFCEAKEKREKSEKEALLRSKAKEREIAERQEKKRREKEEKEIARMKALGYSTSCSVCGARLEHMGKCCARCRKTISNRNREIRRRRKITSQLVDRDITLEALYERDRGVCYICGQRCDYSDKRETDGTIICGEEYPSIDHVVPLSKGGLHCWSNVRLACRKCNSKKGNNMPPPRVGW